MTLPLEFPDVGQVVTVLVPGNPVGKGRPRAARRGAFTQLYTPEKTASYESLVAMAGHDAMAGRDLLLGACMVIIEITVPIAASWSKRKQAQALAGTLYPTSKPDIDNVEKILFDGLNGIVWKDDVQVVDVVKRKRYGATPGVEMTIRLLVDAV